MQRTVVWPIRWVPPPHWPRPPEGWWPPYGFTRSPQWLAEPLGWQFWRDAEGKPIKWVSPPGWPTAPAGWVPYPGWAPPRSWPREPAGWQFWQTAEEQPARPRQLAHPQPAPTTAAAPPASKSPNTPRPVAGSARREQARRPGVVDRLRAWRRRRRLLRAEARRRRSAEVARQYLMLARPYYMRTWQDAEIVACTALCHDGYKDALLTKAGADEGIDVLGAGVAAQVKWRSTPVGRPDIQRLVGASRGRRPTFFSVSGYTAPAIRYANEFGVALFVLQPPNAVWPQNTPARDMQRGPQPQKNRSQGPRRA